MDEFAVLRQRDTIVLLSPREQALAELLFADFGAVVRDEVFEQHVFGESESRRETLRTTTLTRFEDAPLQVLRRVTPALIRTRDMSALRLRTRRGAG